MSNCSNCYTGCSEIVSDKCIKYTGVDVPVLGIQKGDSLSFVEQALVTFLVGTLNGSGITIDIDEDLYCELVSQYLQECSTVTALDLFKALVQAACTLQEQINTINTTLDTLNADYSVECLDEVTNSSDTHSIVQAIITKLCEVDTTLTALALDVETNYVKLSELNTLIQAYLDSTEEDTRYRNRMVPNSPISYVGSLSGFDISGAGLPDTEWEDIYLCNGNNGTPDLRGRVIVTTIVGMGGGALDAAVDPGVSAFNPNYTLGTTDGANGVVLTEAQIPAHTHGATVTDPGHDHGPISGTFFATHNSSSSTNGSDPGIDLAPCPTTTVDVTGVSVVNSSTGGGEAHDNIQPVYATHFIIYIP
jgi:microcystin-dependent protein